jgi:rhodanese-related sulfurtransferase
MVHSPGFLSLVNETRPRVQELTPDEARARLRRNPAAILLDVREDHEWNAGHIAQARHLGKGILERDLESTFPDPTTEILMYCGGGFRSVLTCDAARRLGYSNVYSIIGGYKALVTDGWPIDSSPTPARPKS